MKIYTKTGDEGDTSLFGGRRVGKDDLRVLAYGEVDELNASLGLSAALLGDSPLATEVVTIQGELFTVGADLATPPDASDGATARISRTDSDMIERLEATIDRLDAATPELRNFILPGGAAGAAALQTARAVCRRAERAVVALSHHGETNPGALIYLNRLSDLLFVMARHENHRLGVAEPVWKGTHGDPEDPA